MTAYSSEDMPDRDKVADIEAAARLLHGPLTVVDVIAALEKAGFQDVAARVLELQRQRVIGDYLQPSAIFDENFQVVSALTDPNDYRGPGTGYRVEGDRWSILQNLPQAWDPRAYLDSISSAEVESWLEEGQATAETGDRPEVVVAVGSGFWGKIHQTIGGLDLRDVLQAILAGIAG